jgi:hypothetical protein
MGPRERLLKLYEPTSRICGSRLNWSAANRPDHQAQGRTPRPGASARRGAAWMWPKEGWPAQHGAIERREVSLVEITTGVHRGAGGTWGTKKNPSKLAMDVTTRPKRVWMPPANPGTRARAPPSSTSGAWGGFGVLLYIGFLGPNWVDVHPKWHHPQRRWLIFESAAAG